ncbi:MAG: hypothetical protein A3H06_01425 [Candidatus Colwellbacteria bacterium RIFCSPLOWO2_12_FULL_44_13]|uniref:DUF1573 domain-containing protein n=2 Tax=Candidatus Colwelliibacteriota TaxID=1817904 RepID=A0A1G1Z1N1_9BACT|nr:MAG: hypothetical protein A3F24_02255 [Candidatus Colwellbacteria bacterium RIFCSPHIGHO2_12_FULL_44_17]OGY61335.1 MAG: hypothetical protein A3H06_01425 [Candidatus Colwellbacteria bacterium RIFCSPLOWO2_12_FULL_44_13]
MGFFISMKQSTTLFIFVGVIVLFLAGVVLIAWPSASNVPEETASVSDSSPSTLKLSESSFDFGTISMKAGKVQRMFGVTNTGTTPVEVEKLYTSCMCTTAKWTQGDDRRGPFGMPGHASVPALNATLQPGETANVQVEFDPAAHGPAGIGPVNRLVYLDTGSGTPLEFEFTASVTP